MLFVVCLLPFKDDGPMFEMFDRFVLPVGCLLFYKFIRRAGGLGLDQRSSSNWTGS